MEIRKILVANTRTQQRHELHTDATTLGGLKAAMNEEGIDYSGMTFTEGISKTQLISDESLLPTNVMYKGTPTNELVILLTNTTKNIASGCTDGRSRRDAYDIINENEWMKEGIKAEFGANYTLITTDNLWLYIDQHLDEDEEEEDYEDDEENEEPVENVYNSEAVMNHLYDLVKTLAKMDVLSYQELRDLAEDLDELADIIKEPNEKHYTLGDSTISDSDIDNMINSI